MTFAICIRTALTVALSASSATRPVTVSSGLASLSPPTPAMVPRTDSVCATTQVSGTVTDSLHNIKVGLWVRDALSADAQTVKTDSTGSFHLTVDTAQGGLYVFADNKTWRVTHLMGWYDRHTLQVKNCVAAPITIVLKSIKDILRGK